MRRPGKQIWSRSRSKLTKHMTHEKLGVSAVNLPGACTSTRGSLPKHSQSPNKIGSSISKQRNGLVSVRLLLRNQPVWTIPACLVLSLLCFKVSLGSKLWLRLQKARATPRGALPVEVWCLPAITRKRTLAARQAVDAAL